MNRVQQLSIIGILLVLVGLCVPMVHASPAVMVYSYTLSPEILQPGDIGLLTLTIKNTEIAGTRTTVEVSGSSSTTIVNTMNTKIENIYILAAQYGGKQIRATTNYEDVGYLASGASIDISFKIIVDRNMSEGIYFLTACIDVENDDNVRFPIPVKVSNATIDLLATSVPSKISYGGSTEITVTAMNKGNMAVDGVMVTPKKSDGTEFIPESYFVGSLSAGASEDVVFSVKSSGLGLRNLSFNMSYKNGDNAHTNTLVIPVEVIETLDVAPIITNYPKSITKGGSSRISIEVYNAKTEGITGVLITPICETTVIPSQYFIGSMDPDDVFSASFEVYTDSVGLGEQTIGFKVSYKQGNDYYETPVISKSYDVVSGPGISYQSSSSSSSQSGSNGMPETPSLTTCIVTIIVVIVVIVVLVIFIMKWRKRRKSK